MVSDPKLYNPKIVPTKSIDIGGLPLEDETPKDSSSNIQQINLDMCIGKE